MTEAKPNDCAGWRGLHGLLIICLVWLASGIPAFQLWPWFMLAPLTAYAVLVALVPPLRSTFRAWRFGRVSPPAVAATIILALGSATVLLLFESRTHPDLRGFGAVLPRSLAGSVLLLGV